MTHILNWHSDVLLGVERYAKLFGRNPNAMKRGLFRAERFANIRPTDCGYSSFETAREYNNRASRNIVPEDISMSAVVGDKITKLYKNFDVFEGEGWLGSDVTVLQIIRNVFDVARSYEARAQNSKDRWSFDYAQGISDWAESMRYPIRTINSEGIKTKFIFVNYENLFETDARQYYDACKKIIREIGLNVTPDFLEGIKRVFDGTAIVARRREGRGELVSDEDIRSRLTADAIEDYRKLQEIALL